MAPKCGLCYWWGVAVHLGQKHKQIGPDFLGGGEVINPVREYLLLPLRHPSGDVCQVGIWVFILPVTFGCVYSVGAGRGSAVNEQT